MVMIETLTFLYTDVEGSTQLWEQRRAFAEQAMARQERILRGAIEANGGKVFRTVGDGLCAAFPRASGAVAAAVQAQRQIWNEPWEGIDHLRVRMALHTGEVEPRNEDYTGSSLNRMGRILSVTASKIWERSGCAILPIRKDFTSSNTQNCRRNSHPRLARTCDGTICQHPPAN
jgi:class 3 adenylate cyclase